MNRVTIMPIAVLFGGQMVTASAAAQSLWLDMRDDKLAAVEWLKPNFDGDDRTTFATSLTFLSFRYRITDEAIFETDIPIAHFGETDVDVSETALGNPYLGVAVGQLDEGAFAQLGVRLPLIPDDKESAQAVGLYTDIHRWESSLQDVLPVTVLANYVWRGATGAVIRLRGGPSLWIPTRDGPETEFLLNYAAQVGYEERQFGVVGGFSGTLVVSEEDLDFGERTFNELGAAASIRLDQLRPGIHLRLPLDEDLNEILDFVVGIQLGVALP